MDKEEFKSEGLQTKMSFVKLRSVSTISPELFKVIGTVESVPSCEKKIQ